MVKKSLKLLILKEFIKINTRYKNIKINKNFFDQGVDSLDFYTLIFKIEEKFKIKIPTKLYNKLSSINKIEEFIKKKN